MSSNLSCSFYTGNNDQANRNAEASSSDSLMAPLPSAPQDPGELNIGKVFPFVDL